MGATEARQVMAQLGPSYVAVRPDTFVGMIKGNVGVNVPGLPVSPPNPPGIPSCLVVGPLKLGC
jgi:hypothetical protein